MPLPELPECSRREADQPIELQVELSQAALASDTAQQWMHHWHDPDRTITLSLAKYGAEFILRAHTVADFRISGDCKYIKITADPATPLASIRHLLLDQVLPRIVAQRGRTVLHASAVSVNNTVVAFMGSSGAGKSTIASWLYQRGHALLNDDCLALDTAHGAFGITPSYAGARLWDDSPALCQPRADSLHLITDYSDKLRLQVSAGSAQQSQPLQALLVLEPKSAAPHNKVAVAALTGAEAVMALVQHSFQLDMTKIGRAALDLQNLSAVVNRGLPIYRLSYPHTPAALAEVQRQVYALAPSSGSGTGTES